jgi:hypothetical protein
MWNVQQKIIFRHEGIRDPQESRMKISLIDRGLSALTNWSGSMLEKAIVLFRTGVVSYRACQSDRALCNLTAHAGDVSK